MNFEFGIAKDGHSTLQVNGIHLYSKYKPKEHAIAFIDKELNPNAEGYFLLGLGLGYHLEALANKVKGKQIYALGICEEEIDIFKKSDIFTSLKNNHNVVIVNNIKEIKINNEYQIIVPNVWMQLLDKNHPLYYHLKDIKIKQETYKNNKILLVENFSNNMLLKDKDVKLFLHETKLKNKVACLVSSGPSLNDTKNWLKESRDKIYILCVGSALKVLLNEGIKPDAVIISDPKTNTFQQLNNTNFDGVLFYLCTANYLTISSYPYNRYILFQEGYKEAEQIAKQMDAPLVETGGSVATTGYSLLEFLGFKTIFLFGQDLGFKDQHTHANGSTSGRVINEKEKLISIISNNGEEIYTTPNLHSYLMWFNYKFLKEKINVYNTALHGAKISNVPYINQQQFQKLIR